ncbi:TonB-dependent receptor [Pedobacter sp. ISL-68]|uniref:outer membrane beta-barrel family protein n=1 Tax=unclassified Pedobacter TaxID=2628915 RepID=UPI001BE6ABBC|nr:MULTISPECIES: outer membrane beta-barrel family protein [unclassified Pedobacter]MBT2561896.1 TonB-dependent receptor [Pedobacter sp. ISL-64]MBT2592554.1 TonB-dependent receptor [Pedobacter sp. ISL-68]
MIRTLGFLVLFFIIINCRAQLNLSGKVTDREDKASLFVTIKISDSKNRVNYTQTDSLGLYHFNNLQAGKYSIICSSINFKAVNQSLALTKDTVINIQLQENRNKLADVQINARKSLIEKQIDRTVFNVENSVSAIGTDVLELLSKVPGVRVINDKVSLVGRGSVNIMINDKLVPLSDDELSNYLKSISSGNIATIEVITNPPAKYDAQGNNGLINIVLKKVTAEGFRGSVNTIFSQATHPTASAGGNLSYRKNKITLSSNFNIRKGFLVPFEQSDVFYPTQTWNVVNKDRNFRTVPSGQIGIDYQVSPKTVLGLSYNSGLTNFYSEENIKTTVYSKTGNLDSVLNSDANAKIRSHYHSANIYLKQALDSTGKQLTINGDWFKYSDDKNRFFNNTSYFQNGGVVPNSFAKYLSTSKQNIDLYTIKADVDLPYKTFKLSFGTKLSFINNKSDLAFYKARNEIYELDPGQTNLFNYQENTQALYVNYNKTIKRWDFQAGLRGEYTQIDGISVNEQNRNEYFRFFPTFYIVYRANDKSTFALNYGRRINRPAYRKLNPFRWYSNQYAYTEGNPFLQPSYNDNIEISHTYINVFTTTLSFRHTTNGFNDVNFIDAGTNIQAAKPVNFITGYHYQFSNAVTFNVFKWLESINQVDVFYNTSNSSITQTLSNLNGFGAYFSTLNQFVFNPSKTILGEVSFWYQFPAVDGLNQNKNQYNLDLGIRTLLLNKKIQLAITATDVLKTNQYRFNSLVNNIRQEYNNYYDSRQLRITFRYNFGNEKIKQQDRKLGNEEERRRNN